MYKKTEIVIVNLWGLGDLVPSLYFIKHNKSYDYYLITSKNNVVVEKLIKCFELNEIVIVGPHKSKIFIIFDILKKIFQKKIIIFTAPLHGKSRKLAKIISFIYKKTILANENGNMYEINKNIKIN